MSKIKILVIGSKGFIGTHALNYFKEKNYEAYGADIVVDYTSENYFLIDYVTTGFKELFSQNNFDVCINCSGAANVADSLYNPLRDYRLNVNNVFEILEAIRIYNSDCKMINLSSAAVYGEPAELPVKESQEKRPLSPYGMHKLYSEKICYEYYTFFGIKTISLRVFSAYGEGLRKQLFWDLYKKSLKKLEIKLFGHGQEARDFIYIEDLVCLIEKVLLFAKFDGTTLNAASGVEITIEEAVNTFFSIWKPQASIQFTGLERKGDPKRWLADISLAKKLNFSTKFTLREGLTNYIAWLQKEK
jgi:dTDP-glucose 4,6-dehydratase/UDP-glucose 4-epimerase